MAIIDTSKGVRPCVEELALWRNLDPYSIPSSVFLWQDIKHLFTQYPSYDWRGITCKVNEDSSYTASGVTTASVNGLVWLQQDWIQLSYTRDEVEEVSFVANGNTYYYLLIDFFVYFCQKISDSLTDEYVQPIVQVQPGCIIDDVIRYGSLTQTSGAKNGTFLAPVLTATEPGTYDNASSIFLNMRLAWATKKTIPTGTTINLTHVQHAYSMTKAMPYITRKDLWDIFINPEGHTVTDPTKRTYFTRSTPFTYAFERDNLFSALHKYTNGAITTTALQPANMHMYNVTEGE